jgi:hypothetical protein
MAGIDDWDRVALAAIAESGDQAGVGELVYRVEIEQFDERMARAWIRDALSRGVIHRAGGHDAAPRYALTTKGYSRLGQSPPEGEDDGGPNGGSASGR